MCLRSLAATLRYSLPRPPDAFPSHISDLEEHIHQPPPQILVHIVRHEAASVDDKEPNVTPKGIAITRYAGATPGSPDLIRSFDEVELLLKHGSEDIPGNSFVLRGSLPLLTNTGGDETCQTPFWHAKSLDRLSSGGWHIRLFTLSPTSTQTSTDDHSGDAA